jgi:hypothetical protein
MRNLAAPTVTALAAPELGLAQLVLLDFPGTPIALNTSNWPLTFGGTTYQAAAGLGSISAIEDGAGEIKGLQFSLSGAFAGAVALALDDANAWPGTPITIRTAIVSASTGQVVDAPIEWTGRGDTMSLQEDSDTCGITATAEASAVDLLRGTPLTTSHADQQSVSPTDLAFEYVAAQADQPVVWPSKAWFYK